MFSFKIFVLISKVIIISVVAIVTCHRHGYLILPVLSPADDGVVGGAPVGGHYYGLVGPPLGGLERGL